MRLSFPLLCLLMIARPLPAVASPLLDQAAGKWLEERDHWAFTVRVREFDRGGVKEERQERYDPSRPGDERWQLLAVDGKPPTEGQIAEWQKRKIKKHQHDAKPLAGYFDFEKATAVDRTGELLRYRLPLRNNGAWLFPVDRIALIVTINRQNLAVERIEARISEPYRVALGLAQILDLDLNVQINPDKPGDAAGDPAMARPDGTMRAVVNKLGQRVEYAWSDFKHVTPRPENVRKPKPKV